MKIDDLDLGNINDVKMKIKDDLSAVLIVEMLDGDTELIPCSAEDGQDFKNKWKEIQSEVESKPQLPPKPLPCELCGDIHEPGKPIVCICQKCHKKKEIVRLGTCSDCYNDMQGFFDSYSGISSSTQPSAETLPWDK